MTHDQLQWLAVGVAIGNAVLKARLGSECGPGDFGPGPGQLWKCVTEGEDQTKSYLRRVDVVVQAGEKIGEAIIRTILERGEHKRTLGKFQRMLDVGKIMKATDLEQEILNQADEIKSRRDGVIAGKVG